MTNNQAAHLARLANTTNGTELQAELLKMAQATKNRRAAQLNRRKKAAPNIITMAQFWKGAFPHYVK